MRDYAGFGYASLDLVMYPLNLCEIMRDLVMPRWIWLCILWTYARLCESWLCLVVVLVMFSLSLLSLLFWLCSYSWLCVVYYINDTILHKGYYL